MSVSYEFAYTNKFDSIYTPNPIYLFNSSLKFNSLIYAQYHRSRVSDRFCLMSWLELGKQNL